MRWRRSSPRLRASRPAGPEHETHAGHHYGGPGRAAADGADVGNGGQHGHPADQDQAHPQGDPQGPRAAGARLTRPVPGPAPPHHRGTTTGQEGGDENTAGNPGGDLSQEEDGTDDHRRPRRRVGRRRTRPAPAAVPDADRNTGSVLDGQEGPGGQVTDDDGRSRSQRHQDHHQPDGAHGQSEAGGQAGAHAAQPPALPATGDVHGGDDRTGGSAPPSGTALRGPGGGSGILQGHPRYRPPFGKRTMGPMNTGDTPPGDTPPGPTGVDAPPSAAAPAASAAPGPAPAGTGPE